MVRKGSVPSLEFPFLFSTSAQLHRTEPHYLEKPPVLQKVFVVFPVSNSTNAPKFGRTALGHFSL